MHSNPMDSEDQRSAAAVGQCPAWSARIVLGTLAALVAGGAGFAGTTMAASLLLTGPLAPAYGMRQAAAYSCGAAAGLGCAALAAWLIIWAPSQRPSLRALGVTGVLFVSAFAGYTAFWTACLATVNGLEATGAARSRDWDRTYVAGTAVGTAAGIVCALVVLVRSLTRK